MTLVIVCLIIALTFFVAGYSACLKALDYDPSREAIKRHANKGDSK